MAIPHTTAPRGDGTSDSAPADRPRRRPRFFYGWVVVGVITVSRIASTTQQNQVLSVLVKPVTTEFGWSRSAFIAASSIGTILGGLTALVVGPTIDRVGARWVMFSGFLVMGGLMMAMSSIHALWQFYLVLISTRLILQGVLNLANNVVVSKWFYRKRGRASAIPAIGQRVGAGVMPFYAQAMVTSFGWRSAILSLGVLVWTLTLAPVAGWLRRRPEDMGLLPDGDLRVVAPEVEEGTPKPEPVRVESEVSFTLGQALHTRTFYILLVVVSLSTFTNAGLNFNMFPLLTDRGLSDLQGVTLVSIWSYVGIPTTLLWGFLADRVPTRYLMAAVLLGMGLGVATLSQVQSFGAGVVFALVHGFFFAGALLLQNLIFANYFGRASFGMIRGFITPFQMLSNAFGPLAATLVFDTQGDYDLILLVWAVLLPVLAVAVLFATPVTRRERAQMPSA